MRVGVINPNDETAGKIGEIYSTGKITGLKPKYLYVVNFEEPHPRWGRRNVYYAAEELIVLPDDEHKEITNS